MSAYRWLWWVTLVGVAVPAAALGAFVQPGSFLLVTVATLAVLGAVNLSGADAAWGGWSDVAISVVLLIDGIPVLGARAWAVLGLMLGMSRPVVRSVRRWAGARPLRGRSDRASRVRPTYVEACLGSMTGGELCRAWAASFVGVKSVSLRERRLEAGVRRSLLDELERRDAVRFRAWMARAPSAASEPLWVVSLPGLTPDHD